MVPDLIYSHTINEFSAGEKFTSDISSKIKHMKEHTNSIQNYQYKTQKSNVHINYQIEIIRIVYIDDQENKHISDELRYRTTTEDYPYGNEQGIYFVYSVSPVYIQYMTHKSSFLKLITRLLSAIGGIYIIFGIIDSLVHFVMLKIAKKTYKEIL